MNVNFEVAAKAAKSINGKSGSLWHAMVLFQQDYMRLDKDELKSVIKGQEQEANAALRIKVGTNSTYRVVKGVILSAVEYGVSLIDKRGKVRGKTEVEADIKEVKGEKSAVDKFKSTMTTANAIADKLLTGDLPVSAGLVKELFDKLADRIRDLPSQA
jgi:hypothetical protein